MLCKHEATKAEKAKGAALTVAGLAAEKAVAAKVKADKDIVPTLAEKAEEARDMLLEKAEEARDAAAPHVEKLADKTADQREAALDKVSVAKAAAAAKIADVADAAGDAREDAEKKGKKAAKRADKKATKFSKKADKKAEKKAAVVAALLAAKKGEAEKKATAHFGTQTRQDVAYKAAALKGRAEAIADDKGLSADTARDFYSDEILPHLKEILATAAAAGTAASHNVVGQLPQGAQEQVARYAPQLAPQKKKGGFLIALGAVALAGAGYLVYADQQKKKARDARLSDAAIADSTTVRRDEMTINNPVTNFEKADDTTVVRPAGAAADTTAEPAGGPGTAATWTDAENTGHMGTAGLEDPTVGETRSSRRAAREE